ncbi:class I SAM-dependent methyltransferase (plasmid) [Tundrisphaera lichenicola]|uniref:class I SAM-dependent methyltransferase n=1 Tax=Tundrisphaera lichenicola TaxID=2029860 RepID=UPI003EB84744
MSTTYNYVGDELDLFAAARNWKSYFRDRIAPYLGEDVLEVGAGLGGTTRVLCRGTERRWVGLEPDPALAGRLAEEVRSGNLPGNCEVRVGTLGGADPAETFDTILYMDVLEHIEDDRAEVARAAAHLRPGGHVIALSPAHQWLFTPFDQAIGHHRRYTKATFGALATPDLERVRLDYLDSIGFFASLANRLLLRSAMPKPSQIALWDRVLVRMSRIADPVLGFSAGKSVLAVWRKTAP